MGTFEKILQKYNLKTDVIEIPNVGRDDLAELFCDMGFKIGVEVGVAAGEYSEIIMRNNPQLTKMYGVDPYVAYSGYRDYVRKSTFNQLSYDAHSRLDKYSNYEFIQDYGEEAAKLFQPATLDFVYIDANHSEPFVSQDIATWAPKVKSGGLVCGHDYARIKGRDGIASGNWAVIPAITKYAKEHDHQLFIWGLEAKIEGLKRESIRSWMFVQR